MHPRPAVLGWGVFLVLAGAVALVARSGTLTSDQIGRLWDLWPLVLIGIGVGLILRRTRFDFLGGLIVAATLGLMAGGLLSAGLVPFSTAVCGGGSGSVAFPAHDGTFTGAAKVALQLDCGTVTIGVAPGSAWHAEGRDADGTGPDVTSSATSLSVLSKDRAGSLFNLGRGDTWQVTLPGGPRLDLDLRLDAGTAAVDLAGAQTAEVHLELNAASAAVDLGAVTAIHGIDIALNAGTLGLSLPNLSMTGTIEANAGTVRLCVPSGAALRLQTGQSIIGSYAYDGHGLVKDGSTWTTPGFDTAAVRIELRTAANAGSFTLDPEDGCA